MRKLRKGIQWAGALIALSFWSVGHAGPNGLLGVQVGYPQTTFTASAGQGANYDGTTLTITSTPQFTTFTAGGTQEFVSGASLQITASIDAAGTLSGGSFTMSGTVTDSASSVLYNGVLLSGTVADYGISKISATVTLADFVLNPTAGSMLGLLNAAQGGAIVTLENATFNGSFATAFSSTGAKGAIGPIPAPQPSPGTATLGYWKNHPNAWPLLNLTVGGVNYTQAQALSILKTPPRGDKTISMAQQLIPAKLNVALGNVSSCIDDTIVAADNWLALHGGIGSGQRSWDGGDIYHDNLDAYNNGELCAPHMP